MHTGLEARVVPWRPPRTPRSVIDLRRMTAVEGEQLMGPWRAKGAGEVLYRHEFAPGTGPMMQRDLGRSTNNMVLHGGSYRINDEGMIEDMAHRRHHHRYTSNPEHGEIAFLVLVGLALFVAVVVTDLVKGALPARWNARYKSIGVDAALIGAGIWLYKKSHIWGIALAGAGVVDAAGMLYTGMGLDQKINTLFHRTTQPAPSPTNPPAGLMGGARNTVDFQRSRVKLA